MFSVTKLDLLGQTIECREETLTGIRCRISPSRGERALNNFEPFCVPEDERCVFCPENIERATPCFENGERIYSGDSVTFPNSFPFGKNHIVTVVTKEHCPVDITEKEISYSLKGQFMALKGKEGFVSVNWNYLPSAGASMIHPHIQGLCCIQPSYLASLYLGRSGYYYEKKGKNYWSILAESEKSSERYLFGDEIVWCANPVPAGEKEIRGYLPVCSFEDFEQFIPETAAGIKRVIELYRAEGSHAFNMSIKFGRSGDEEFFRSFISMIARIDPNPMSFSDTAFMERLHLEPVVMTLPEELGLKYREKGR